MGNYLSILLILMTISIGAVGAQTDTPTPTETETPTITPTPSNTPTPTPDLLAVWTLPPDSTAEATDEAGELIPPQGRAVAIRYEVSAGEFMIAVLLFGLLVTEWVSLAIRLWRDG